MIQQNIIKKITILQGYLDKLIAYSNLEVEEITNNFEKLSTMERLFILMADEAFDINSALAYQLGNKIPESNKSTFYEIANLNLITKEFADKIALSAKIRNNLVHNYEEMQNKMMVEEMKKFTELYSEYIKILINKFVK
jgi:uncharacterized protein YutE (UPF0331/DUF86 family)